MVHGNTGERIQVAIIAGGKSLRFGAAKGLVCFQGKTLLQIAITTAKKLSNNIMVIAAHQEQYRNLDIPVIVDKIPGCGPLGGLHTALFHASASVATLPCDIPLLSATVYIELLDNMMLGRPVVARSHIGLEPLVAIWPTSALPEIDKLVYQGKLALHVALKKLNAIEVNIAKLPHYRQKWFYNVNTRKDLQWLEKNNTYIG